MYKIILLGLLTSLISLSCKETIVQNPVQNGSLFIDSKPQGAKIYIQGTFIEQYTPATIKNLEPDSINIKVEVEPGTDSSFTLNVKYNQTTSKSIDFIDKMGKCLFESDPAGAEIILDSINTNKKTPEWIYYLKTGHHHYTLVYNDIVFEDMFNINTGQLMNVYHNFSSSLVGSIFIDSSPDGALITVDGNSTNKFTPDSVTHLPVGEHFVKLTLNGYRDTTFSITVQSDLMTTKNITLVSTLSITSYGPVRIWETTGTSASQPSGLDLSSGYAYGMSSTDKDKIDIYYSTTGTGGTPLLIQSADLYPNLTRHTLFYVGNGTDINDGEDSPNSALSGWIDNMSDRESNYVFLYDEDNHYSKLIITDYGGGTGTEPAWVEVTWEYNNTGADTRF